MVRAYRDGGKVLMLGVDYASSTYAHLVEVILWNRRLERDPKAGYVYLDRPALGAFWDGTGQPRRGPVASADCRLFGIRDYVDTLVCEVEQDLTAYVRNSPHHHGRTGRHELLIQ
jgi:aminoglycoside N3'-acetyltransferase